MRDLLLVYVVVLIGLWIWVACLAKNHMNKSDSDMEGFMLGLILWPIWVPSIGFILFVRWRFGLTKEDKWPLPIATAKKTKDKRYKNRC